MASMTSSFETSQSGWFNKSPWLAGFQYWRHWRHFVWYAVLCSGLCDGPRSIVRYRLAADVPSICNAWPALTRRGNQRSQPSTELKKNAQITNKGWWFPFLQDICNKCLYYVIKYHSRLLTGFYSDTVVGNVSVGYCTFIAIYYNQTLFVRLVG